MKIEDKSLFLEFNYKTDGTFSIGVGRHAICFQQLELYPINLCTLIVQFLVKAIILHDVLVIERIYDIIDFMHWFQENYFYIYVFCLMAITTTFKRFISLKGFSSI